MDAADRRQERHSRSTSPLASSARIPKQQGLLYAGTEFGAFVSFNAGKNWQPLQQNLPVTPVTDIKVHRNDLVIATMGRSAWIMDNITPLQELARIVTGTAPPATGGSIGFIGALDRRSSQKLPGDRAVPAARSDAHAQCRRAGIAGES